MLSLTVRQVSSGRRVGFRLRQAKSWPLLNLGGSVGKNACRRAGLTPHNIAHASSTDWPRPTAHAARRVWLLGGIRSVTTASSASAPAGETARESSRWPSAARSAATSSATTPAAIHLVLHLLHLAHHIHVAAELPAGLSGRIVVAVAVRRGRRAALVAAGGRGRGLVAQHRGERFLHGRGVRVFERHHPRDFRQRQIGLIQLGD